MAIILLADTYIADLFLRLLNSLQLRCVCDHTETFPFILLEILPVDSLRNTNTIMLETRRRLKHARQIIRAALFAEMNYTSR